jgi:hypothetical protein
MIFWKRIYLSESQRALIPLHNFGLIIKQGEGYIDIWKIKGGIEK